MKLFLMLVQIHLISLVVCALVLSWNLPKSVRALIDKNSRRMDGSVSRRRKHLEFTSIRHALTRVYVGLVMLFVGTSLVGLLTAELALPLPSFDSYLDPIPASSNFVSTAESPPSKMPWPLIAVYLVSTLMIAPQLIASLYRSAVSRYSAHANMRFQEYWQAEWLLMRQAEMKEEFSLRHHGPLDLPTN